MRPEYTKILTDIIGNMTTTDHIKPTDIPNIDLYMDQVTSFMDEHLKNSKRFDDDKILTKTMINNYTKNKLLPPPDKKRYSKEHMILLIFIYYFKGFLSLGDVQQIMTPLQDLFSEPGQKFNVSDIYEQIYEISRESIPNTASEILDGFHKASHTFEEYPEDKKEFIQLFSFICLLSFDIYLKKQVIEKLLDNLPPLKTD